MPDLPHLTFIEVDKLFPHERHDNERTRPLILRIRSSGVWRNPPIVAPLEDESGRYMILDGANRITALQEMRFPHALVQVVQPDEPGVSLLSWNHVIWELNPRRFMLALREIHGIDLHHVRETSAGVDLMGSCGLALVQNCKGRAYTVCAPAGDLPARVGLLNAIVNSYKDHCRLDRTSLREVLPLREVYPHLCGLVIFPQFKVHDLLRLVAEGCLLPTGITRFMVSPRALHLDYPLSELASDRPLESKNEAFQKWIQERLTKKGVRYYAEATFLFDE